MIAIRASSLVGSQASLQIIAPDGGCQFQGFLCVLDGLLELPKLAIGRGQTRLTRPVVSAEQALGGPGEL